MRTLFILLCFIVLISCAHEDVGVSRGFYMGQSVDINSTDSFEPSFFETFGKDEILYLSLKEHGLGFQNSIHDSLQINVCQKWSGIELPSNQKICLAISPLALLAEGEFQKHSKEFPGKDSAPQSQRLTLFGDPKVRQAYLDYCKQLIDVFKPSYFNMGENVNELFLNNPEGWADFASFHQYIYLQLKTVYPNLCVFSSLSAEPMVEGALLDNDFLLQRLASLQIVYYSDLYALSISNHCINRMVRLKQKNVFKELLSISEKPLALSLTSPSYSEIDDSKMDLQEPSMGLNAVFNSCLKHETAFIVSKASLNNPVKENIEAENLTARNETWEKYFGLDFKK